MLISLLFSKFFTGDLVELFVLPSATIEDDKLDWAWAGSIRMEKVNVLPLSTPSELTETYPSADSTIYWTMVRPSPIPSEFNSAVRDNFPKRVKSNFMSLAAMPAPVSYTSTTSM